jgi:hypothetical protein
MKTSQIKQIIKEEIILNKLNVIDSSISSICEEYMQVSTLNESILGSLMGLFLDSKYRKKAEELKKSPEYKDLMLQMKVSAESLNAVTEKLKKAIDEKQAAIAAAKSVGIKLKPYTTIDDLIAQFPGHAKLLAKYKPNK